VQLSASADMNIRHVRHSPRIVRAQLVHWAMLSHDAHCTTVLRPYVDFKFYVRQVVRLGVLNFKPQLSGRQHAICH
jgi:hypothetical protein